MEKCDDRLLNEREAGAYAHLSERTFQGFRLRGYGGPPYVKLGRAVRYRLSDLTRWVENHTVQPAFVEPPPRRRRRMGRIEIDERAQALDISDADRRG